MICEKCGAPISEDGKFCEKCGTPVTAVSPPPQPMEPAVAAAPANALLQPENNSITQPLPPKKKPPYTLIGILSCAVILLIVSGILFAVFSGSKAGKNAEKYVAAVTDMNYAEMRALSFLDLEAALESSMTSSGQSAEDMKALLTQLFGFDSIQAILEGPLRDNLISSMKSSYGDDYKITVKAEKEETVSKDDMADIFKASQDSFSEFLDSENPPDFSTITEICKVDLSVSIAGSLDSNTQSLTLTMVKAKGKWLVLDAMNVLENIM